MKHYLYEFELTINENTQILKIETIDYDKAMNSIYDYLKEDNLLHCYKRPAKVLLIFNGCYEVGKDGIL